MLITLSVAVRLVSALCTFIFSLLQNSALVALRRKRHK